MGGFLASLLERLNSLEGRGVQFRGSSSTHEEKTGMDDAAVLRGDGPSISCGVKLGRDDAGVVHNVTA